MSAAPTAAGIETVLEGQNTLTLPGNNEITGALEIKSGKTLIITGNATLAADVTGAGTLIVAGFTDNATSAAHVKTAKVEVTGSINDATLKALADNFATLKTIVLDAECSENVATATNFYAMGTTAVTGAKVPAGTYTYYAANTLPNAAGTGTATHAAGWFTQTAVAAVTAAAV